MKTDIFLLIVKINYVIYKKKNDIKLIILFFHNLLWVLGAQVCLSVGLKSCLAINL